LTFDEEVFIFTELEMLLEDVFSSVDAIRQFREAANYFCGVVVPPAASGLSLSSAFMRATPGHEGPNQTRLGDGDRVLNECLWSTIPRDACPPLLENGQGLVFFCVVNPPNPDDPLSVAAFADLVEGDALHPMASIIGCRFPDQAGEVHSVAFPSHHNMDLKEGDKLEVYHFSFDALESLNDFYHI